jgi:hypothetical protein
MNHSTLTVIGALVALIIPFTLAAQAGSTGDPNESKGYIPEHELRDATVRHQSLPDSQQQDQSQVDGQSFDWPTCIPESSPTLELPVAQQLPPAMVGCFQGTTVNEDATVIAGRGSVGAITPVTITICYRRGPNGKYQLRLDTALVMPNETEGYTSFTGFLMKTRMLKVDSQVSDIQLQVVPQDEDNHFEVQGSEHWHNAISLVGLHGKIDASETFVVRCQLRSKDSAYCHLEEMTTQDDGLKILGHDHLVLQRIGTEKRVD